MPYCLLGLLAIAMSGLPSAAVAARGGMKEGVKTKKTHVRYKSSKEINFEELLIQGKLERPNLSVVTGSVDKDNSSLLRLRKDFLDRVSMDFGEEAK